MHCTSQSVQVWLSPTTSIIFVFFQYYFFIEISACWALEEERLMLVVWSLCGRSIAPFTIPRSPLTQSSYGRQHKETHAMQFPLFIPHGWGIPAQGCLRYNSSACSLMLPVQCREHLLTLEHYTLITQSMLLNGHSDRATCRPKGPPPAPRERAARHQVAHKLALPLLTSYHNFEPLPCFYLS